MALTRLPPLAILVLALSLTGNPGITGPIPGLTLAANGLLLILSGSLLYFRGRRPGRPSVLALLLSAFAAISSLKSPAPYLTNVGLASLAGFTALILGLDLSIYSRQQWKSTARGAMLVCLISSLYALYRWSVAGGAVALQGNFTNPDTFSVVPLIGFFLALSLSVESQDRWRPLHGFGAIVLLVALILTASRAALAGLTVGYVAFLFTLASSRSSSLRGAALKLFVAPLVLILFILISGTEVKLFDRLESLSTGHDPASLASRWDVVRHGYRTVLRSPLFGSGLGCFHLAYQRDRTVLSADEDYMNVAHNDYMQWLVETGIPGGSLWILLLLNNLWKAWGSYKSPTPWVAGQIGATSGIAVFCLFNFACPVPAALLWIGLCLGLGASLPTTQEAPTFKKDPKMFPLTVLLAVWGIFSIRLGLTHVVEQSLETRAEAAEKTLDWESAVTYLEKASQQDPLNFRLHLKIAELTKKAFLFSGDTRWSDARYRWLHQAYEANPRDLQVLLSLARFLDETGHADEATPLIQQAEREAAYSPYVQRAKARNQILTGQFQAAVATLTSIEKTGRAANDEALAALVYLLEAKDKDRGSNLLVKLTAQDAGRALTLGLKAAQAATDQKDYAVALRLLRRLRYAQPEKAQISWQMAQLYRITGEQTEELKALNKLRADPELKLDIKTQEEIWQRWCDLQIKQGNFDLVLAQLDDYLISHQRVIWPRQRMAEIYLKRGQKAEARSALREGIPYDTDGSLRIQLADLCASQGFIELARSYYREALGVSSQKAVIEQRLAQLKKAGTKDDDDFLEPAP